MSSTKPKMSASYKAIFILSIFMVFFVLIVGAITNSKTSGFGMWIWGYTAWLMYKRRNADLVSLYKFLLWFDAIAAGVVVSILLFSYSDVSKYVGYSVVEVSLLFIVVFLVTYGLYRYFKSKNDLIYGSSSNASVTSMDEKHWEQVSEELRNGQRIDSLWIRAFSEADGDNNKANARYIKLRVDQLKGNKSQNEYETVPPSNEKRTNLISSEIYLFWDGLNFIGKFGIIGGIILLAAIFFQGNNSSPYTSPTQSKPYNPTYSNSQIQAQNAPLPKITSCEFEWNPDTFKFDRLNDAYVGYFGKKSYVISKLGFDKLVSEKIKLLREADKSGDVVAAKAFAKQIKDSSITIFHKADIAPKTFMNGDTQAILTAVCSG